MGSGAAEYESVAVDVEVGLAVGHEEDGGRIFFGFWMFGLLVVVFFFVVVVTSIGSVGSIAITSNIATNIGIMTTTTTISVIIAVHRIPEFDFAKEGLRVRSLVGSDFRSGAVHFGEDRVSPR